MNINKIFKNYQKNSLSPEYNKFENFSKYTRGQTIARFLARYEIFKKQLDIKVSVVECGVNEGMGLLSLAHFSVTLEPYNYQRKIIGFDSFEGFPSISKKDNKNKLSFKGSFKLLRSTSSFLCQSLSLSLQKYCSSIKICSALLMA